MPKSKIIALALVAGLAPAPLAAATDFDGSKPLLCATTKVMECAVRAACSDVAPESAGVPQFLRLDFKAKTVSATGSDHRTSKIERTAEVDGKLIVQGAEDGIEGVRDGVGWSLAIDQATGKSVLAAAGDGVGFVVFGACTVP